LYLKECIIVLALAELETGPGLVNKFGIKFSRINGEVQKIRLSGYI
jgi:hypothetical protein